MPEDKERKKGLLAGLLELLGEDDEDTGQEQTPAQAPPAPAAPEPPEARTQEPPPAPSPEPPQAQASEPPPAQAPAPPAAATEAEPDRPAPEPPRRAPETEAAEPVPRAAPARPVEERPEELEVDPEFQRLASPSVAERRAAMAELVEAGITPAAVAAVQDRLLLDPEIDIRLSALGAFARRPDLASVDVLRQALQDPADEVRAASVRLMSDLGAQTTGDLVRLVGSRRWPLTQYAAFEILPALIERAGLEDAVFDSLLDATGRLESPPGAAERSGLARISQVVGAERLKASLGGSDSHRLGAARLLLEEGSPTALSAVAAMEADPVEEVRVVAALARSVLSTSAAGTAAQASRPPPPTRAAPAPPPAVARMDANVGAELVAGLARTLTDPDESVRVRARDALAKANRNTVTGWVRGALRAGAQDDALIAAQVAEALGLSDVAIDVLERAAGVGTESRSAFLRSLGSFDIEAATLAALARSVEASRRPEALRILSQLYGQHVLPHLRPYLSDTSGQIRLAVLEIVGASGEPDAPEVAMRVLESDSSPAVRATAVKILAGAEVETRQAALARALQDGDPDVRATAVELLTPGMARRTSEYLLRATEDPDERVRGTALRHLAGLGTEDFAILWAALRGVSERQRHELLAILEQQGAERIAELASIHLNSPSPTDRALAVELAGMAGTPECVRQTINALQDPAPGVRRRAAAALSGMRSPEAIPALSSALKDPNPKVRIEATRALGMIDDDEVIPALISALKDPEVRVRDQAADVLIRWSSPGVARQLVDALRSADLNRAAGDLLSRMGMTAVEPLVEMLLQGSPELTRTVGELLQKITGPDPFLDELASLDPVRRLRAVEALGAMGGPRAVDGLVRALADPDERIRVRGLQHLGRLGDRRAIDDVRRTFASDPVFEVAEAAEEALQRLEPPD